MRHAISGPEMTTVRRALISNAWQDAMSALQAVAYSQRLLEMCRYRHDRDGNDHLAAALDRELDTAEKHLREICEQLEDDAKVPSLEDCVDLLGRATPTYGSSAALTNPQDDHIPYED